MDAERLLRRALMLSAPFNVGGAALFAFPASPPSQLVGMPADVPVIYRAFVALFILLFGASYAWLSVQPAINRPFVAFGAIGKTCAFLCVLVLLVLGQATVLSLLAISGDLVFAAVFFWCLRRLSWKP